ncbi:MAG: hypothetical protein JWR69_1518 [Pedosphaera sp.]|nr:hypothetical protein [Pedosphaera sp.]
MEEPEVPTEHLEEKIHHEAEHSGKRWVLGVALSSALLASLAAVASLSAGHFANEAMISQIESANQWSYFQSKSIKEAQLNTKMELLAALGKPASDQDRGKLAGYEVDKAQIQKQAENLEHEAKHYLRTHQFLARSVTMFQVAIAIGAISVLTKRRKFWFVSLCFGAVGLCFLAQSWFTLHGH